MRCIETEQTTIPKIELGNGGLFLLFALHLGYPDLFHCLRLTAYCSLPCCLICYSYYFITATHTALHFSEKKVIVEMSRKRMVRVTVAVTAIVHTSNSKFITQFSLTVSVTLKWYLNSIYWLFYWQFLTISHHILQAIINNILTFPHSSPPRQYSA